MTFLEKIAQEAGAEAAQAIVEEAAQEAVAEASAAADEAGIDASPEELAQAAAAIVEEKVEEKAAAVCADLGDTPKPEPKQASFLLKKAAFEVEVTKIARHILATNGFNPDTGERIPRMSLARTPEEVKYAAALESLETAGWPVQWDPSFLARAVEEG